MDTLTLKYEGDYLHVMWGEKILISVKQDENPHVAIERLLKEIQVPIETIR